MSFKTNGILTWPLKNTPVAVLDFETTGLNAGIDRVVKISIVRVEPDSPPQLIFDTLINPNRKVTATEIHGITDQDVADAPFFEDIAGNIVRSLYDCVLASYNIYFDIRFFDYELQRAGIRSLPPHLCLMYLRPMLGLGKRCTLDDACKAHKIEHLNAHSTASDTVAAARLWSMYQQVASDRHIRTFKDLANLSTYKFIQSFQLDPMTSPIADRLRAGEHLKSRSLNKIMESTAPSISPKREDILHSYWEALKTILSDMNVTNDEIVYLNKKKQMLNLTKGEIRSLHARAFAETISQCIYDKIIDDDECQTIRRLHECLSRLGWAPGE